MRNVLVRVIDHTIKIENSTAKDGPGPIEKTYKGKFHKWGLDYIEYFEEPAVNYTVGIVELEGGQIITAHPNMITFLDMEV